MSSDEKLVIVMWSADPTMPDRAAAPFVYALAARALEIEVEMHFTAGAVRWLFEGVAEQAFTDHGRTKTVRDFIREASAAGVRLYACAMALAERRRGEALIAEMHGIAGAATVIGLAVEPSSRVMVF
ncbi:MAG: DsrE family protein [Burkholderiales bacterium]|nr:DsrE family protein [Burkholderiales bacterium]